MDPVGALIGSILLGFGMLLVFGSVRNKKVFGDGGMLTSALTTGSLVNSELVPQAYETATVTPTDTSSGAVWVLPRAVRDAVAAISTADPQLGELITAQLNQIDSDSTLQEVTPLGQSLQLAEAKGRSIDEIGRASCRERVLDHV